MGETVAEGRSLHFHGEKSRASSTQRGEGDDCVSPEKANKGSSGQGGISFGKK